jgi:hypothetical protein
VVLLGDHLVEVVVDDTWGRDEPGGWQHVDGDPVGVHLRGQTGGEPLVRRLAHPVDRARRAWRAGSGGPCGWVAASRRCSGSSPSGARACCRGARGGPPRRWAVTATAAPSAASRGAMVSPIPRLAPVTITALELRSGTGAPDGDGHSGVRASATSHRSEAGWDVLLPPHPARTGGAVTPWRWRAPSGACSRPCRWVHDRWCRS